MNILYLVNHLNVGGITSYVLTLGSGLRQRGHRVWVASGGGEKLESLRGAGIECLTLPLRTKSELSPKLIISFLRLTGFIRENRIQLIHAHSRTTQVLAHCLAQRTGAAYLSTCHGFFKPRFSRRIFPCWGRRVIAISSQVRDHLVNDFKLPLERIRVIHNGIDVSRFLIRPEESASALKTGYGLGDGPVIGIVARLSEVKGHLYLIEAMPQVRVRIPSVRLFIVGQGRTKPKLLERIRQLELAGHVVFLDHCPDTRRVLAAMDVFVMPSLEEGLGLALEEAMAFGLPVAGSDIGGIRTLIADRTRGLLVAPRDTAGLSRALISLLTDTAAAGRYASAGQQFIQANFSQEQMVQETERVYEECVAVVG